MFNKKQKKIEALEAEKSFLEKENDYLKKQLTGDHAESGYCRKCEHSIFTDVFHGYACALECKCKDFKEKAE